jgi:hypothetical protein
MRFLAHRILLGFIGIYVGMIFQEVKARPVYIARSISPAGEREQTFSPKSSAISTSGDGYLRISPNLRAI